MKYNFTKFLILYFLMIGTVWYGHVGPHGGPRTQWDNFENLSDYRKPSKPYLKFGFPDTGVVPAPFEQKGGLGLSIQFGLRFYS